MHALDNCPVQPLTAEQARAIMYSDMSGALVENILIAAYCAIRTSTICGSKSISDDFGPIDPDNPGKVRRAVMKVAKILGDQGYACTVCQTALDVEWEG